MIPRGLALAMAAGVAASAAIGVALLPYALDGAPVYVEGDSLSLFAERADYGIGEEVRVRLINTGSTEIAFAAGSHHGLAVTRLDGATVYAPPGLESGPLAPRDSAELAWDQARMDGSPVHPGTYRIVSEGTSPAGEAVRATLTINIHG